VSCDEKKTTHREFLMERVLGCDVPAPATSLKPSTICPNCDEHTVFDLITIPVLTTHLWDTSWVIGGYACRGCHGPVAILWHVYSKTVGVNEYTVDAPQMLQRTRRRFEFEGVPDNLKGCIREGLDCLSVNAYNGFAALCRKVLQMICSDAGAADATSRVQQQINEAAGLGEWDETIKQEMTAIMLVGHDGVHPNLPEVYSERAESLFSLLQEVVHDLYTRPERLKTAGAAQKAARERKREEKNRP